MQKINKKKPVKTE